VREILPFRTRTVFSEGITLVAVFRLRAYATFLVRAYDGVGLQLHDLLEALRLLQRHAVRQNYESVTIKDLYRFLYFFIP